VIPAGAKLEKEVNVVLSFREISKFYNVLVVYRFPGFDLIFERVDEVLFGETFIFA
jgi:hypothetical protein